MAPGWKNIEDAPDIGKQLDYWTHLLGPKFSTKERSRKRSTPTSVLPMTDG